jgi:hypothetical protein
MMNSLILYTEATRVTSGMVWSLGVERDETLRPGISSAALQFIKLQTELALILVFVTALDILFNNGIMGNRANASTPQSIMSKRDIDHKDREVNMSS